MANSVTRINNSQDNKIYNVQQFGAFPVVVFGRTIKENSVPGTQYYFQDGMVKIWKENTGGQTGYQIVYYFGATTENPNPTGACIFTVPDNFDFSKMTTTSYVAQYCRSAKNLNADTVSPNYIIRNGEFICVKAFQFKEQKNTNNLITIIQGEEYLRYYKYRYRKSIKRFGQNYTKQKKYCRTLDNKSNIQYDVTKWKHRFFIQPCGSRMKIGSIYKYEFRAFHSQQTRYASSKISTWHWFYKRMN